MPAGLARIASNHQWELPRHLALINRKLLDVAAGRIKRLAVTLPPRHGKSEFISKYYPAWYLGRFPDRRVILTSYEADFAASWGRKAKEVLQDWGKPVFGAEISEDSSAANRWDIKGRAGGMNTAGVGGPITGKGANLFIIDDPVKNAEESFSKTMRDKAWDWYRSTAYTRLEPNGAIILMMCMTGDTPVLMADGTERPLCEIKAGNKVATYDDGKLGTSTVLNHRNSGHDNTYSIKTISGKTVRANERHPFLVEESGKLQWKRLRDLNTDYKIVTLKDNGVGGKERTVLLGDVRNPPSVGDIVTPIIIKRCGPMGTGRHRSIQNLAGTLASNNGMESPPPSMMRCSRPRGASAPSADSFPETMNPYIGPGSCVLTTTTSLERSEVSYAMTVTSPWHTPEQRKTLSPSLNTSDFTTERIASIEPAGIEEVFDIEIERTGNFIANGLVSHNTRWNEDDMAGRIFREMQEGGDRWDIINLPAFAESNDPLGRKLGEALWRDRFNEAELEKIKRTLGSYWFTTLYQQRPQAEQGFIFRRQFFRYFTRDADIYTLETPRGYKKVHANKCAVYQTCDPAASTKTTADYFVLATWAATPDNELLLLDILRTRLEGPDQPNLFKQAYARWHPTFQAVEKNGLGLTLYQTLLREGLPVKELAAEGDKVIRALPAAARMEAGTMYFLKGAAWLADYEDELTTFNKGKHDDQVDVTSYAVQCLVSDLFVDYDEDDVVIEGGGSF